MGTPSLDNDASTKKYVDDINTTLSGNITALQTKTQNIESSNVINTITKTTKFKLSDSDIFTITDDSGPFFSVTKFQVQNTNINVTIPMSMNNYQLSGIPTPINDDQCPNKLYVDTRISDLSGTYSDWYADRWKRPIFYIYKYFIWSTS